MTSINIQTALAILRINKLISNSKIFKKFVSEDVFNSLNSTNLVDYTNNEFFLSEFFETPHDNELINKSAEIVAEYLKKDKKQKFDIAYINQCDTDVVFAPIKIDEIRKRNKESELHRFRFNVPIFDTLFPDGIDGNSFNLIAATSNVGKTTYMVDIALTCARRGMKVYYASFEESVESIYKKFVKNFYNIGSFAASDKINAETDSELVDLLNKNLTIKSFNKSVSIFDYLADIEQNSYEVIFCDYFQHFEGDSKKENHINYKFFSETISRWCKEPGRFIPFFSGVQMNRTGYGDVEKITEGKFLPHQDHIGGSMGAGQASDNIINLYSYPPIAGAVSEDAYGLIASVVKTRSSGRKDEIFYSSISKISQRVLDCSHLSYTPGASQEISTPKIKEKSEPKKNKSEVETRRTSSYKDKFKKQTCDLDNSPTVFDPPTELKFGDVKEFVAEQLSHSTDDDFISDIKKGK